MFFVVAGNNNQELSFLNRESLNEFKGGFHKSLFEESDLIVNVLLETVSEKVLSFHSDSLSKTLEISGEVNDVDYVFDFSDTAGKNLFFPGFKAGSLRNLV